jgi:hypothetical protein
MLITTFMIIAKGTTIEDFPVGLPSMPCKGIVIKIGYLSGNKKVAMISPASTVGNTITPIAFERAIGTALMGIVLEN